jgi:hypothetical protein
MVTEVSGSGVSVITVVGMEPVGPTETVELETDQWKDEEEAAEGVGVTMTDSTLDEVSTDEVEGSGVEVVEGSAGTSEVEGSAEVVGTALDDFRGQSTTVGLHWVMVTS